MFNNLFTNTCSELNMPKNRLSNIDTKRIIVYSPDEITNTLIHQTLQKIKRPSVSITIERVHFFDPTGIDFFIDKPESQLKGRGKLLSDLRKINKENVFFITVFRDPVERGLASIFKYLDIFNKNAALVNIKGELEHELLRKLFCEQLVRKKSFLNYWLGHDFKSHFGFNFSQLKFDHDRGFGITETKLGKILLLRHESLHDNFPEAIEKLLGIIPPAFEKHHDSKEHFSHHMFSQATGLLKLPEELLNAIYCQPEVQLIYPESTIDKFKNRWITTEEKQGYQEYWRLKLAKEGLALSPKHNESKLIIVAGLPRSGSTLLYNIVAQILEKKSIGVNLGYIDTKEVDSFLWLLEDVSVNGLIKVHAWNPLFQKFIDDGAFILFSFRDLRDSSASAMQKGFIANQNNQIVDFIHQNVKMSHFWEQAKNLLLVKYEEMAFNVPVLIQDIANLLDINVNAKEANDIAKVVDYEGASKIIRDMDDTVSLKNGAIVFDAKTQLHTNHLAGGSIGKYNELFSTSQISEIEKISYRWLRSHGYEPKVYQPEPIKRYFGKNGEDFVLWQFFDFMEDGFYVDAGAFDGIYLSNSYSFDLGGWSGICIEASPEYAELLKKNRPACSIINSVLVENDNQKKVDFYCDSSGLFSSLSNTPALSFSNDSEHYFNLKKTKLSLPAETITAALKKNPHCNRIIDFISIDAGGDEIRVLEGLDFEIYSPRIFLLTVTEATTLHIQNFMAQEGYTLGITLGNSLFFAKDQNDIHKLQGISVNCQIEKQRHPKGTYLSKKEYLHGVYIRDGRKITDILQELEKKNKSLSKTIKQNKEKAGEITRQLKKKCNNLSNTIKQNKEEGKRKVRELKKTYDNLSQEQNVKYQDLSNELNDNKTRMSVFIESLQEKAGFQITTPPVIQQTPNGKSSSITTPNLKEVELLPWHEITRIEKLQEEVDDSHDGDIA